MYRFVNFKGFADATLELRTPVTILIGRNGSGKSNVFEGIQLISALFGGVALSEIGESGGQGRFLVRGGLPGCIRHGSSGFGVTFQPEIAPKFMYTVEIAVPDGPGNQGAHLSGETLTEDGRRLAYATKGGPELVRFHFDHRDGGGHKAKNLQNSAPVLPRLGLLTTIQLSQKLAKAVKTVLDAGRMVYTYDPIPLTMRGFVATHSTVLFTIGSNLAATLFALKVSRADADAAALRRIVTALHSLPEEPFSDLEFIHVAETQQVMIALRTLDGALITAQSMSDGTLRTLAMLAALETVPQGALVLLEEFDNGLHPSRASMLLDYCWTRAQERGVRILATTHNAATLDSLTADRMAAVVLCWWDQATKSSQLKHLIDLPDPWPILEPGHLGDAATTEQYRSRLAPDYAVRRREAMLSRIAETQAALKAAEVPK